jgi:hypothetical protein
MGPHPRDREVGQPFLLFLVTPEKKRDPNPTLFRAEDFEADGTVQVQVELYDLKSVRRTGRRGRGGLRRTITFSASFTFRASIN